MHLRLPTLRLGTTLKSGIEEHDMDSRIAKLILLVVLIPLSSCRVGTAVFQGGDVISLSGSRDCMEGRTCEVEVTDAHFSETCTAVPKPGYAFVKWRAGDGHLCANSTNPLM